MQDKCNSGGTRYLDKDGLETPRPDKLPHENASVEPVSEKGRQRSVVAEETGGKSK